MVSNYAPKNINGDLPGACNVILWHCKHPDCDFHYASKNLQVCPICNTPREYCSLPNNGNTTCVMHSNKALNVSNSRKITKRMPARMIENYLIAYDDPALLDFTDSISLMRARREDLFDKLDETPGAAYWVKLKDEFARFQKYQARAARGDTRSAREMAVSINNLEQLIIKGYFETNIWQEILDLEERMRKMRESEIRRREKISNLITPEQFKTMLGYIVNTIKTRVSNADEREQILADLRKMKWG